MKTVIEMAEAVGITDWTIHHYGDALRDFAELVRADERERIYFQTSSDFVKDAIAEEREACAGLCDRFSNRMMSAEECADAIRARSNT